jgi:hypothetical protein
MYMQHLKQDDSIRNAIHEMQQLPEGFSFNPQKAWSSIEKKLPEQSNTAYKWYWAAATLVLTIVTLYFNVTSADHDALVKNKTPQTPSTVIRNDQKSIHTQNAVPTNLLTGNPKKIKKNFTPIPNSNSEKHTIQSEFPEQVVATVVEPPTLPVIIVDKTEKPLVQEIKTADITKPVTKKYKVIHINELNPGYNIPAELKNLSKYEFKKAELIESTTLPTENFTRQLLFFKKAPSVINTTSISEN